MSLFQKSVTNKYLKNLDNEKVSKAYENFQKFYGDKLRLHNIMQLKEENYQEGFLREIFVETLGYTINPDNDFNLTTEFKNLNDARKADGAILDTRGHDPLAIGVIELKSTKTKHLESIKEQAFSYKNNQPGCRYVITSNFQSLRFYIDDATEYEEFNLFNLKEKDFKLLYLLLSKESIFSDLPERLKQETKFHENDISAQLYTDYKRFKNKIFENLVKNNPQYDKLLLFKKSQKLLDRFLFVFFAEDSGLIPPNAVSKIVEQWKMFKENDEYFPLYSRFQKLFSHLDKGYTYKTWGEIPAYNGGLFRNDELLDSNELKIDDEVLEKDSLTLSAYDFNTEVDVNILGHIFEHSLNEIEEITAKLTAPAETTGHVPLKKTSKRKKDGIFYTPKYITKYIVENTVGTLCNEKKEELKINNLFIDDSYRLKTTSTSRGHVPLSVKGKKLYKTLNNYKDRLLTLKILDPACGSGAFLNATLDFLIAEHKQTDNLIAELTGDALGLFDTDKAILENNIYGVDINEESVEIAKLSMWLRTAQKGRPLSDLSGNIKCGNSLIDDPEVAGDKAFNWNKEFPQIFKKQEKEAWHITLATHDSRTSQRMIDHKVRLKRDEGMRPKAEPIWLNTEDELFVTKHIAEVIKEDNLNVTAYNICGDHVHMLLICEKEELPKIIGKIKAVSAKKYNIEKGITIPSIAKESDTIRGHVLSEEGNESESNITKGHVLSKDESESAITREHVLSEEGNESESTITRGHVLSEEGNESESATTRGHVPLSKKETNSKTDTKKKKYNSLWVQKFGKKKISDKKQYENTLNYIVNNRIKHELPENKELQNIAKEITCTAKHAFRPEYTGGFDVVIGNPPYVQANEYQEFYINIYQTIKCGDLYTLFFEKGIKVLKSNGLLGYITPSSYMTNIGFLSLRKYLLKYNLKNLFDLGSNVFSDASVDSAVIIVSKDYNKNNLIIKGTKLTDTNTIKQSIFNEFDNVIFNIYTNPIALKLANKLNIQNQTFGDYLYFSRGVEFGFKSDKVFDINTDESFVPLLCGGNISKNNITFDNKYIKHNSNDIKIYKSPNIYEKEKILIKRIGNSIIGAYDNSGYYNVCDVYNLQLKEQDNYNLAVLSMIINSKLINFYYDTKFKSVKKLFPKIPIQNLKLLPLPQYIKQLESSFIEKADQMLSLNKELQNKSDKFIKRIKSNLEIEKLSGKLQKFYNYDFKTFIAELNKQKIKLLLTQQDEWEDYFDTYKQEINELQNQIAQTDKEIDKMVYDLYELTEEEILIVENSLN